MDQAGHADRPDLRPGRALDPVIPDDLDQGGNTKGVDDNVDTAGGFQINDEDGDVIIEDQLDDEQRKVLSNVMHQLDALTKKLSDDIQTIESELAQKQ